MSLVVQFDDLLSRLRARPVRQDSDDPEGERAAVAAILRPGPDAGEILFIRRAEREGDPWSGHMAFPGGRKDPSDASARETAVRETLEELGLDLNAHGELVTRLPGVQAMTKRGPANLVVVPFVFVLRGDVELRPNHEVAEALWTPYGRLLRGEGKKPYPYEWGGIVHQLPSFDVDGRIVWGLTHRMLEIMADALA